MNGDAPSSLTAALASFSGVRAKRRDREAALLDQAVEQSTADVAGRPDHGDAASLTLSRRPGAVQPRADAFLCLVAHRLKTGVKSGPITLKAPFMVTTA